MPRDDTLRARVLTSIAELAAVTLGAVSTVVPRTSNSYFDGGRKADCRGVFVCLGPAFRQLAAKMVAAKFMKIFRLHKELK